MEKPKTLSTRETARILGVDERTVRRMIVRKELVGEKHGRVWRVDAASVEEMRKQMESEAGAEADPVRDALEDLKKRADRNDLDLSLLFEDQKKLRLRILALTGRIGQLEDVVVQDQQLFRQLIEHLGFRIVRGDEPGEKEKEQRTAADSTKTPDCSPTLEPIAPAAGSCSGFGNWREKALVTVKSLRIPSVKAWLGKKW